jgi:hypothetical protein
LEKTPVKPELPPAAIVVGFAAKLVISGAATAGGVFELPLLIELLQPANSPMPGIRAVVKNN